MRIGVTGTRNGMTLAQHDTLADVLRGLSIAEFHHGGCRGVDVEAAR